jgi:hypothetical protein
MPHRNVSWLSTDYTALCTSSPQWQILYNVLPRRFLVTDFNAVDSRLYRLTLIPRLNSTLGSILRLLITPLLFWNFGTQLLQSQSRNYFTTGDLPPISSPWRQAPWETRPNIVFQMNTCGNSPYVNDLPRTLETFGTDHAQKTDPLPNKGCAPLLCIPFRGNVFIELFLSNRHGAGSHRKHLLQCVCVLQASFSNGSVRHNIHTALHINVYKHHLFNILTLLPKQIIHFRQLHALQF